MDISVLATGLDEAAGLPPAVIRPACPVDEQPIFDLMKGEPVRPVDRQWHRFLVAEIDGRIVGAIQMRHHRDGASELGSLVVAPVHRGRGLGTRLIDAALDHHVGTCFVIARAIHAEYYRRWGFRTMEPRRAPASVRRFWWLGNHMGWLMALVQRRARRRLLILRRDDEPRGAVSLFVQ